MLLKNVSTFALLISAISLVGCNATQTSLSTTRMDSPEVNSKALDAKISLGFGQRQVVNLVESSPNGIVVPEEEFESIESEISPEISDVDTVPVGKFSLSVAPRFEVSLSSIDDNKISIKYQLKGDTADNATAGNYSQAISLGLAKYSDDASGLKFSETNLANSLGEINRVVAVRDFEQDTYAVDIAWIHGYRVNDNFLIYGGPYFIYGSLDGEQTDTFTNTNTFSSELDGTTLINVDLNSTGSMFGVNVAGEYEFDFGLFATLEFAVTRIDWEGASASDTSAALVVGYHF